ncbi:MAG: zinc carboxypeptidase [Proteobacteria bacterium]|nr:zinc carboxypeptidase [Pseudomonadota bacterium]MCP4915466.1 zinc carboxypeptidase [Pseudomonadota bacterium]
MTPLLLGAALAAPVGDIWVRAPDAVTRAELDALGLVHAHGREGEWGQYVGHAGPLDAAEQGFETRDRREDHRDRRRNQDVSLDDLEARLRALDGDLVQVGTSLEGRPIWGIRLGTTDAPRLRVLGGHHGDEPISVELALHVAEQLAADAGVFAGLTQQREIWVVPLVNPDGYVLGDRQNANDVDLNRNYGDGWRDTVFSGPAPFSEPETRAIRTLSVLAPPHAGLSMHSGAFNLGYPWNQTVSPSDDEADLIRFGTPYAEAIDDDTFSFLNGADWYITYGDTNDWSLGAQGAWDYTLEVSLSKAPSDSQAVFDAHVGAVAAFLASPVALQGRVVDATTGLPLAASVTLDAGTTRVTSPVDGRFSRAVASLEGGLTVTSPGYDDLRVEALDTELLVELTPSARGVAGMQIVSTTQVALTLDGDLLVRPGYDDIALDGPVDPADLAAGPWSLVGETTSPAGVFVSDPGLACRLWEVDVGEALVVSGEGFAEGTRAWLLLEDRAWRELVVTSETPTEVVLDGSSLPLDGTADLVLVSNGVEVAIADLLGEPVIDTSILPEPQDTGITDSSPSPAPDDPGYEGCASVPRRTLGWALLCAVLLRRRRP